MLTKQPRSSFLDLNIDMIAEERYVYEGELSGLWLR